MISTRRSNQINGPVMEEVQELLRDCVITPINQELEAKLQALKAELTPKLSDTEKELKTIKSKSSQEYSQLKEDIEEMKGSLLDQIECMYSSKKAEEQHSKMLKEVSEIQKTLQALTEIQNKLETMMDKTKTELQHVQSAISIVKDGTSTDLKEIKEKSTQDYSNLKSDIIKMQDLLDEQIENLVKQAGEQHSEVLQMVSEIQKEYHTMTEIQNIIKETQASIETMKSETEHKTQELTQQLNTIAEKNEIMCDQQQKKTEALQIAVGNMEQKQKKLWVAMLISGSVNLVGIIIVAILLLL